MLGYDPEAVVIVTLWEDPSLIEAVPNLTADHFTIPWFGEVCEFVKECYRKGVKPQLAALPLSHLIKEELKEVLESVEPVDPSFLPQVVSQMIERKKARHLREILEGALQQVDTSPDDVYGALLGELERFGKALGPTIERAHVIGERLLTGFGGNAVGCFGLDELDRMVGGELRKGIREGSLIVLAGGRGVGKTSLAVNTAYESAAEGYPVGFFSLEMTEMQLMSKLLARASVDTQNLFEAKDAFAGKVDPSLLKEANERLAMLPIYCSFNAFSLGEVISQMQRLWLTHGVRLFIIDYLQRVEPPKRYDIHELGIAEVARELKTFALSHDSALLLLSQVTKTPTESYTRYSRTVEYEADVVLLLEKPELRSEKGLRLSVTKNRLGEEGKLKLLTNLGCCVFDAVKESGKKDKKETAEELTEEEVPDIW